MDGVVVDVAGAAVVDVASAAVVDVVATAGAVDDVADA